MSDSRAPLRIHLIGVCGTGMASLAGLLRESGHQVSGSDSAFYPPMSDQLERTEVETFVGFDAAHISAQVDLVIVGNVCRRDNVEAQAALARGIEYMSFPAAMARFFLADRPSFVIAGTHGKSTTTSLVAFLLHQAGVNPGLLVGGSPRDFDTSFRIGHRSAPFVIEGDEYDSAYFEKTPKFWQYQPDALILTAVERDHVDIYDSDDAYSAAFEGLIDRIPPDGLLVAWAGSTETRRLARRAACRVTYYGLDTDDCDDVTPVWSAAPVAPQGGVHPFDLFVGGSSCGRVMSPLFGRHNMRNALAAIALAAEAGGVAVPTLTQAMARFRGIRRRQELLGIARGVRLYDDFAHHPTAVEETLRAMRQMHPDGQLIAAFEPRSATACRNLHQDAYPAAFALADLTLLAPLGRSGIPDAERLDLARLASDVEKAGKRALVMQDLDALVERAVAEAAPGDTIVLMSNGSFGGVHDKILAGLAVAS